MSVPWLTNISPEEYLHRLKLGNARDQALAELGNAILADQGVLGAIDKFRSASRSYANEINWYAGEGYQGHDCRKGIYGRR